MANEESMGDMEPQCESRFIGKRHFNPTRQRELLNLAIEACEWMNANGITNNEQCLFRRMVGMLRGD